MALYESTFIANQELTSKQVNDLVNLFSEVLKEDGGKIVKTEHWGVRNFAYPIKKQKKGYYVMLAVESTPANITKLNHKIKTREEILKSFSVKVDKFVDYGFLNQNKEKNHGVR